MNGNNISIYGQKKDKNSFYQSEGNSSRSKRSDDIQSKNNSIEIENSRNSRFLSFLNSHVKEQLVMIILREESTAEKL